MSSTIGSARRNSINAINKDAFILFTRVPVPGRVKTRLMPFLSPGECAALQKAMLFDVANTLSTLKGDLFVFYSDEGPVEMLDGLPKKARLYPQEGGDLGERMYNAIHKVLALGYEKCLLLGSNLPFLRGGDVEKARQILEENDLVLCPSPDGGYWLVGMHTPIPTVFQKQKYGTGSVLADTLELCRKHGFQVGLGPVCRDLDTPEDLKELLAAEIDSPQIKKWVMDWVQYHKKHSV